jgi:alpha-glucuronidase
MVLSHRSAQVLVLLTVLLLSTPGSGTGLLDPMWLRFPLVPSPSLRAAYASSLGGGVAFVADASVLASPAEEAQLHTAADELTTALSALLGTTVSVTCCGPSPGAGGTSSTTSATAAGGVLLVSVGQAGPEHDHTELGPEGYSISIRGGGSGITLGAMTASGALYGMYRLLSTMQRGEAIEAESSVPHMTLRIWDLWDDTDGDVTRGYAREAGGRERDRERNRERAETEIEKEGRSGVVYSYTRQLF